MRARQCDSPHVTLTLSGQTQTATPPLRSAGPIHVRDRELTTMTVEEWEARRERAEREDSV